MDHPRFCTCLTLFFLLLSPGVFADEADRDTLYKKIYKPINMLDACVRLTNATHEIGCGSPQGGNSGTVEFVDDKCNTKTVTSYGQHPPYVAVIGIHCFNSTVMHQFVEHKSRVAGVIINGTNPTNLDSSQSNESPALHCPNGKFGVYDSVSCSPTWNENGSMLAYKSLPFPVFILDSDNIEIIYQCYSAFNLEENDSSVSYPLCKVNMESFMYAAIDTPTCMNREKVFFTERTCDPLGGHQIWGSMFPLRFRGPTDSPVPATNSRSNSPSIVFLAAKMDTSAFFHKLAYGAENDVTGMVVLMAALEAMGKLKGNGQINVTDNDLSPIVFAFFNGEEWDYIGSSNMVQSMMTKEGFPDLDDSDNIYLDDIKYFLELRQLGLSSNGVFYGHRSYVDNRNVLQWKASQELISTLQEHAADHSIAVNDTYEGEEGNQLPPSSLQQFLKPYNDSRSIAGIVVTDHKRGFMNRFYGSIFDSGNYIKIDKQSLTGRLANLSTVVARTALQLAGAGSDIVNNATANESTIEELLYCFLFNSTCEYFVDIVKDKRDKLVENEPIARYVGVAGSSPFVETLVNMLAERLSGSPDVDKCTNDSDVYPDCWLSYVYKYEIESPAFCNSDYDSTMYSTWAESEWSDGSPSAQMFVVSSGYIEHVTLGVGCTVLVLSFPLVFLVTRRIEKVFVEQ